MDYVKDLDFYVSAQEADYEIIKDRFPFIELYQSRLNRVGGKGSVFGFGNNFSSCCIENSVLINRHDNVFRCKKYTCIFIVKKTISKKMLIDLFEHSINENEVKGSTHYLERRGRSTHHRRPSSKHVPISRAA